MACRGSRGLLGHYRSLSLAAEPPVGNATGIFRARERRQLSQPRRLRQYRDLMAQPAITAGNGRDEHHSMRQREVQRTRDDDCGKAPGLFRAGNRVEIN